MINNYLEKIRINNNTIVIREPSSLDDYQKLMNVQIDIWGMQDYREAVAHHMIIASHRNGGVVLGAFEEETGQAVGLVYSTPGYSEGTIYLYSHLTGVIPKYRYKGIGYLLKLWQRRIALEKGYYLIKWTFDPMQSSNAFFNIVKLGVIVRSFYPNYYGELMDEINRGMPSDRFIAEWWIRSARVKNIIEKKYRQPELDKILSLKPLIANEVAIENGMPIIVNYRLDSSKDLVLIEIPGELNRLRKLSMDLVLKWRSILKEIFTYYINKMGYTVIGFTTFMDNDLRRSYYILWRRCLEDILSGAYPWS
ncbi:MAG: hypothetical protein DRO40_11210 [Thermoprotei archaeon]|nr:MAG: hypothetical protein DRO40_11210 [Thermoprotei archaeon]